MHTSTYDPKMDLGAIQYATRESIRTIGRTIRDGSNRFSLLELIESKLPGSHIRDALALENTLRLSDVAYRSTGVAPLGTWVPLQLMSRDLTTANSGAVITAGVSGDVAAGQLGMPGLMSKATVLSGLTHSSLGLPLVDGDSGGYGTSWIGDPSAVWIADGGTSPQQEPSLAVRSLVQKTMTITMVVSRRLLMNSSASVEQMLREEIMRRFRDELERAIINGDGVNQPLGILRDTSAFVALYAGANGGAPTWAQCVALETNVSRRGVNEDGLAWIMSPLLRQKMRTTSSADSWLLRGRTLMDYPVHTSEVVPDDLTRGTGVNLSALLFGDLSELFIGFWGPAAVDLLVDPYTIKKDGRIRLIARADVGAVVRRPNTWAMYKDLIWQ